MRRATKIVLVTAAAAVLVLVGTVVYLLGRGYSALAAPAAWEEAAARRLRHLATPRQARAMRNPLPRTPEVTGDGRGHFADHCAICHGNDGSGETEIGERLYPKAPDMRKAATQRLSDGELFYIIRNGVRFTGMPGWGSGPDHEDQDSWALVHFIRHLPEITAAELAEMKRLNPKSPHELEAERETEEFLAGGSPGPSAESPTTAPAAPGDAHGGQPRPHRHRH